MCSFELQSFDMKHVAFFISLCLLFTATLSKKCVTYEECVENIQEAIKLFNEAIKSHLAESKDLNDYLEHIVEELVNELRDEIAAGPPECLQYQLQPKQVKDYTDSVVSMCNLDRFNVPIDKAITDEINHFPPDFIENNTPEEREKYCKVFIKALNYYCNRIEEKRAAIEQCDLKKQFNKKYREPWEKCKRSVDGGL